MTSDELIHRLGLMPGTCGYMAKTFESPLAVEASGQTRSIGAALYFLVTPERGIEPHRIHSDQMYHHYAGDPLEVLLLGPQGDVSESVLGGELANGMPPQLLIPARTFHLGRLGEGGQGWALLATTSWPTVAEGEFERASIAELQRDYPAAARRIAEFA